MFIINVSEKEASEVTEPGAEKVKIKWLLHKGTGARKFHLRTSLSNQKAIPRSTRIRQIMKSIFLRA